MYHGFRASSPNDLEEQGSHLRNASPLIGRSPNLRHQRIRDIMHVNNTSSEIGSDMQTNNSRLAPEFVLSSRT